LFLIILISKGGYDQSKIFCCTIVNMSEYTSKKKRTEHTEHSESCGCESVTGVTEEDTQERE